ncbi:reverse transcriptase domain-containing protein [Tanacetum coccineum]
MSQKRRTFSPEKGGAVTKEVAEWIKAGIVVRSNNPTLLLYNTRVVKMCVGSWKIVHEFKNLNSANAKGLLSLPNRCKVVGCGSWVSGKSASWMPTRIYQIQLQKRTKRKRRQTLSRSRKNLEAYVDDMVIKSKEETSLLADIAETFEAERALPFFNTLKNITKENKHEYRWTAEAEEAFQQMKRLIMSLPSLTPPFPEETLYAYLAVSREAVSAVLLTDRNGRQCPVQYVSRTLNEAERNYSPLEKLALSLVNMTRRTEASGKLAKYAVEIGTYKISFMPRNAVKGQVLADFLSDAPEGEREDEYFQSPEVSPEIDDTGAWTLYTDGAASSKGSGAGLILIGPSGVEYAYALRLTFASTNNEAEYEALLAGLRIARMMNVLRIEVKVDSKLVASQINGMYEASNGSMIKYLAKARKCISEFKTFSIENIPRGNNQKADVLSKLATVPFHNLTKEILVEVLNERSTEVQEVQTIVEEEGDNWMTPIIKYLEEGIVPSDNNEARALRAKIGQYTMESGVLFKKGYLIPMLRCVGPLQANYVIREIHMGSCGMHVGPRAVVRKAMRQGYYWPTMHADAKTEIDKCDSCQIHSPIPRLPKTFMTSIMAPWPFYQWGMDILGPLTPARGGAKFVIVAIDYFTKWVEAKPRVLDKRMNTAVAHPQANGLVERANQSLMEGIKTRLGREKAGWVDELPNVLWAHRTFNQSKQRPETPLPYLYGSECGYSAEIGCSVLPDVDDRRN